MGQKILIICCALFAASVAGSYKNKKGVQTLYDNFASWDSFEIVSNTEECYTIHTEGCIIPSLKFLDRDIKKFVEYPYHVHNCKSDLYPMLGSNTTTIWVIHNNLMMYKISSNDTLKCCYRGLIIRKNPLDGRNEVEYKHCIGFNDTISVNDEFVRVTCGHKLTLLYDQYFAFPVKKRYNQHRENPFENLEEMSYNVMIMGLSAVSRLNFHRTMPGTSGFLKKKGAIEFMGYNVATDDSRVTNLIPVLMGMSHTELKATCWPKKVSTYDRCPLIWDRFKDLGYYTALLEDTAKFSTFNVNYNKVPGFINKPTDFYLYPFVQEIENTRKGNPFCLGSKYAFQLMLDYQVDLALSMGSSKLFSIFWESSMSYKDLNNPMLMDLGYKTMLNKLDDSGYLNKTFLIVLSDHGQAYGNITKTKQGRLEQRLPILYILPPPSFNKKFSLAKENLKENSKRLTTPYDLHDTLIDLLDLDSISHEELLIRKRTPYAYNRGISLFSSIPANRTCKSASISDRLCTCFRTRRIQSNAQEVQEAAKYLMEYLNTKINSYTLCATLTLDRIVESEELSSVYDTDKDWRDFLVVIRTSPGGGVFEATMRRDRRFKWAPSSAIIRHNLYSDQSYCVDKIDIKMYCYCL